MTTEVVLENKKKTKEHFFEYIDITSGSKDAIRVITGFNNTDKGNAERLVALFGDKIRYCKKLKSWFVWDNTRWLKDEQDKIIEIAKATVDLIHVEVGFMPSDTKEEKDRREDVSKWAFKSEEYKHLTAMVRLARSDTGITIRPDELDANPFLLNCPNGTIDFERREFREHRREDMLTKMTMVQYDPHKTSVYFYPVLLRALPLDVAVYAQRLYGSNLGYTTKKKELIIPYGDHYAAKSSITQCIYGALGDYAASFPIAVLQKSRHGMASNAARPEIVELEGVRIAWSEELPEDFVFNDRDFKTFTSSGVVSGRGLFQEQRQIRLGCTFSLETNSAPTFDIENEEQLKAAMERVRVVPFVHSIPKEERDEQVFRMMTEGIGEMTVALAWVVQGYFDREDDGLPIPESVKQGTEEYERNFNPLATFIREEVIIDDGRDYAEVYTSVAEMLYRFQETVGQDEARGINPRSFSIHFGRGIKSYADAAGVKVWSSRKHDGVVWHNVRLRDEEDDAPATTHQNDEACRSEANPQFGETSVHDLYRYYEGLTKSDFCFTSTRPSFPTILVDELNTFQLGGKAQNDEAKPEGAHEKCVSRSIGGQSADWGATEGAQ
ncbi:MAG: phage/plasmid primase, P4 family [Halobacteriota archaeon]